MKIILDTNFIISAAKFKIDIFEQLKGNELFITDSVKRELEKLAKTNISAKIALKLVEAKGLKTLKSKQISADKDLIEFSNLGYVISTQDRILRKKIKAKTLYIRQRKYVCE